MNYDLELKSSELVLLRRALKSYVREYREMIQLQSTAWEKEQLRQRMNAAERLHENLIKRAILSKEQLNRKPEEV